MNAQISCTYIAPTGCTSIVAKYADTKLNTYMHTVVHLMHVQICIHKNAGERERGMEREKKSLQAAKIQYTGLHEYITLHKYMHLVTHLMPA